MELLCEIQAWRQSKVQKQKNSNRRITEKAQPFLKKNPNWTKFQKFQRRMILRGDAVKDMIQDPTQYSPSKVPLQRA